MNSAEANADRAQAAGVVVRGTAAGGFEPVRDAFIRNFTERGERGAAVTVYYAGEPVVDLWAGTKDFDGGTPWEHGTAQIVRSATKGVAAAVLLLLRQRGLLDPDAPVAAYWPEFKAHGKERIRVGDVLSHRAGLPVTARPLTVAEAADPDLTAAAVAAAAPVWEPGTDHGYHAHTYGWLVSELVRRVTGRDIGAWIADEIAGPLGLDLWLGLPDAEKARVGKVGPVEAPVVRGALSARPKRSVTEAYADPASLTRRAFDAITPPPDENDAAYRAAVLPASNGIATAGALARFYAGLTGTVAAGAAPRGADGGVGGVTVADGAGRPAGRLFDPDTLALARAENSSGPDRVLIVATRFGLGYMLHGSASPLLAPGSFGHPGRGGSLGFADPESDIAFGYVTNGLQRSVTADPRAQALIRAVRTAMSAR